jgi:enoyl-CoA hydratase/carnithine racemase
VTDESDEILSRVEDGVGFVTLNRPKAINSLNQGMVDELRAVLAGWEQDAAVRVVVLSGAGERGLCAGGDVVAIYHSARADGVVARRFWRDEYLLNGQIGRFPKTYVSLMDGIVMGGGVGVGAHASTRVVTDTSKMAMPEVGIGFIPDVGGTICCRAHRDRWVCTRRSPVRRSPAPTPSPWGSPIILFRMTSSTRSARPSSPMASSARWPPKSTSHHPVTW